MPHTQEQEQQHLEAKQKARAAIESIFDRYHKYESVSKFEAFDHKLMNSVQLIDAGPGGRCEIEFTPGRQYANLNGVIHGGACALFFDMCTTIALGPVARPGYWDFLGGVTRILSISYLKPIPVETPLRIHSTVIQHGRTCALIQGKISSVDGGTVYATCEHHKINTPTRREHLGEGVRGKL